MKFRSDPSIETAPRKENTMTTNMKPADELYQIRQQIRALAEREAALKAAILDGRAETHGDFAMAWIVYRPTTCFDRKAAESELGSLARFDVKGEGAAVLVRPLTGEDE